MEEEGRERKEISSWKTRSETGAEPLLKMHSPRASDQDQLINCQHPQHIWRSEQKGLTEVISPGLLLPQREVICPDHSARLA